ncbi:hypothetical protein JNUCC1_02131 [Lentibacillus sp. JNUCC-1]|uniref:DUF3891 family protein n=1 Tax=Lentibacillus sp. JNUCC-1 TaxID=2654513 RepID=UPI0012E83D7F|nr:hypothetical protein [Lentibacillus sp. JNUCC-1]
MIVRERPDAFVMIEQHHHARISRDVIKHWSGKALEDERDKDSVLYAIEQHDRAWIPFDKAPLWNDFKQAPYTFTNFPDPIKTVMYKNGIDQVEAHDRYAALLCSEHYVRFMEENTLQEAKEFVSSEKNRQNRVIRDIDGFDSNKFAMHYELLKLADNLSLYICLNEPGVPKEKEHPFFREGIPIGPALGTRRLNLKWADAHTIHMEPFPFREHIDVQLNETLVIKRNIHELGLINASKNAEVNTRAITITASN